MTRLISWPVRYGFGLALSLGLAAVPWVMMLLYSPLPPDLRVTATALAATRTAHAQPVENNEQAKAKSGVALAAGYTQTPEAVFTSTPTHTLTPMPTRTPLPTLSAAPVLTGLANETVNAYTCPGRENRNGSLEEGMVFTILGWDETAESDETITWLLIKNDLDKPQMWIKDSEYLLLDIPEYKSLIPRLACRR